jgi:hypothetical protein
MALLDVLSLSLFVSLAYMILNNGPTVGEKGKASCPFR